MGGVNIICLITVAIGSLLMPSNMLNYTTWQIIPYSICAIAGTWLFFNISKVIANSTSRWKKFMVFVGDNTMTILTWHFLCFKLVSLLIIGVYGLPIERLAEFPIIEEFSSYWILYMMIGVFVPLGIIYCLSSGCMNNLLFCLKRK